MQNEKPHLTQVLRDITQVVLLIGTRKAESGANFTYVKNLVSFGEKLSLFALDF